MTSTIVSLYAAWEGVAGSRHTEVRDRSPGDNEVPSEPVKYGQLCGHRTPAQPWLVRKVELFRKLDYLYYGSLLIDRSRRSAGAKLDLERVASEPIAEIHIVVERSEEALPNRCHRTFDAMRPIVGDAREFDVRTGAGSQRELEVRPRRLEREDVSDVGVDVAADEHLSEGLHFAEMFGVHDLVRIRRPKLLRQIREGNPVEAQHKQAISPIDPLRGWRRPRDRVEHVEFGVDLPHRAARGPH
jgi:hypothetical protein